MGGWVGRVGGGWLVWLVGGVGATSGGEEVSFLQPGAVVQHL